MNFKFVYFFKPLLIVALFSCVSGPSSAENWDLERVSGHSSLWEHRFENAESTLLIESESLRTSKDPHVVEWRNMIKKLKLLPTLEQLEKINYLVNKHVKYVSDYKHYKKTMPGDSL